MRNKKKNEKVAYHTLHFICSLTRALRPKEKMSVSDWADKHMVLPGGSNKAGKFRSDSVPYQKEIMNAITDSAVTEVTVMSSAQIGKTTIVLCGIAYYIEHEPSTQLLVLPTLSLGEKFSKTRLAPMIRDIPVLRDKIAPAKSKDSDNTILFKQYAGGYIVVSGANSAASLSSMPIRVVWMDEVDRFPASAGGEGDPVTLAQKRATTFWNKKYIKTSTPTTENGRINKEYLKGTQEEWCVQCPCCGMYQPYSFKRVDFNIVGMKCEYCGEVIEEKYWKESEHMWIAAHPERKNKRSFHLNAMASPWVAWSDIIDEFQGAIPLNSSPRSKALYQRTGELLGMSFTDDNTSYKQRRDVRLYNAVKRSPSMGGEKINITYSPTIQVNGNADEKTLTKVVKMSQAEFAKMMQKYMQSNKRVKFS